MNNIKFHKLKEMLVKATPDQFNGIFLICGESFLVKEAFNSLCDFLLEGQDSTFTIEKLEGDSTPVGDIVEHVSTLSFLVPKKITAVLNMPLFSHDNSPGQIRYNASDLDFLTNFLKGGVPENHFLIMTSNVSDKRKKIYKAIQKYGFIIDCTVASGSRKADLDEQISVLKALCSKELSKTNKKLDTAAFKALTELTDFNLEIFAQNLEKLVIYVGQRNNITSEDVRAIVVRDKKDPVFNLTNAIMEKELKKALNCLNSLLTEGFHPLQILKSLENLIRKLIITLSFVMETYPEKKSNFKQVTFNQFKQTILPKIVQYDQNTIGQLKETEAFLSDQGLKKKNTNDLLLAPNPKNAYPVFQIIQKSENFSLDELSQALFFLSELDEKLKSSNLDEKTQIENFIINLCS